MTILQSVSYTHLDTTAKAGYSENQTGLALDFTDTATGTSSVDFANTPAGKWLYAVSYTHLVNIVMKIEYLSIAR